MSIQPFTSCPVCQKSWEGFDDSYIKALCDCKFYIYNCFPTGITAIYKSFDDYSIMWSKNLDLCMIYFAGENLFYNLNDIPFDLGSKTLSEIKTLLLFI